MKRNNLIRFFNKHIKRTAYKAAVLESKCLIGSFDIFSVFISTKSLKHLFDKKPAEEFHFIMDYLHLLIENPDKIYRNKLEKHGDICLITHIRNSNYLCSLQKVSNKELQVVTAFRLRDENYIKKYTLLWNRGSGKPHRYAINSLWDIDNAPQ